MNKLTQQYENAKNQAMKFMQMGEISAYLQALAEMNKYKRMMTVLAYNQTFDYKIQNQFDNTKDYFKRPLNFLLYKKPLTEFATV